MGLVLPLRAVAPIAAAFAALPAVAAPPQLHDAVLAISAGDDAFDWMVSGQTVAAALLVAGLRIARGRRRRS